MSIIQVICGRDPAVQSLFLEKFKTCFKCNLLQSELLGSQSSFKHLKHLRSIWDSPPKQSPEKSQLEFNAEEDEEEVPWWSHGGPQVWRGGGWRWLLWTETVDQVKVGAATGTTVQLFECSQDVTEELWRKQQQILLLWFGLGGNHGNPRPSYGLHEGWWLVMVQKHLLLLRSSTETGPELFGLMEELLVNRLLSF